MKKLIVLAAALSTGACVSQAATQATPAAYERPPVKNSYGAIAASRATLATGYAMNQETQDEANRLALDECQKNSEGTPCQVRIHLRNACGAVADGTNMHAGYAWGTTRQKAEAEAMKNCTVYGQNCQVSLSFCSDQRPATREEMYR